MDHTQARRGGHGRNVEQDVFSFMTTLPNALTAGVNHERSPVVLASEDEQSRWLFGSLVDAMSLVTSFPAERMAIVQEGFEKRDALAAA